MIELSRKTTTAETKIGSQRDVIVTMVLIFFNFELFFASILKYRKKTK